MERTAVFIDAGYLNKIIRELGCQHPDLLALSESFCAMSKDSARFRTYYYDCMPYQGNPPTDEDRERYGKKDKFVATLRRLPAFEVRLGRLARTGDGFTQKMVDILFSIDLVRLATKGSIQKAIIVTGDSDFVPSIRLAKDEGVFVHLFYARSGNTRVHDELFMACDERTEITREMLGKIQKTGEKKKT